MPFTKSDRQPFLGSDAKPTVDLMSMGQQPCRSGTRAKRPHAHAATNGCGSSVYGTRSCSLVAGIKRNVSSTSCFSRHHAGTSAILPFATTCARLPQSGAKAYEAENSGAKGIA